jgi:carbon-monoxide dehydrogenase small subunit
MSAISLTVNGRQVSAQVQDDQLLVDFLRKDLGLTGTHTGCDTSQCGACTIELDGRAIKSCTYLAARADGSSITTIEGLAQGGKLHPMQEAFREHHALQCGYCTPGMIMSAVDLVKTRDDLSEAAVREAMEGNLCRCTGYQNIVKAVCAAAPLMKGGAK